MSTTCSIINTNFDERVSQLPRTCDNDVSAELTVKVSDARNPQFQTRTALLVDDCVITSSTYVTTRKPACVVSRVAARGGSHYRRPARLGSAGLVSSPHQRTTMARFSRPRSSWTGRHHAMTASTASRRRLDDI